MKKTRSQTQEEIAKEARNRKIFENPPASPSVPTSFTDSRLLAAETSPPATSTTVPAVTTAATIIPAIGDTSTEQATGEYPPNRRTSKAPSIRSNASTTSRIRQAEFEAEERLAAIRKKELELEAAMIKKKLALDIATLQEETERESLPEEPTDRDERVDEWIRQSVADRNRIRGEIQTPGNIRQRREEPTDKVNDTRQSEDKERREERRRYRSPTPARSRDRGIERLAETLERMTQSRPPPRQALELPAFNGAPNEWLPFKAAMRDIMTSYQYSPTETMARLRNCLKGDAREAVSALLFTESNPLIVMTTLEQCFGRPEVLVDKALNDLKRLPKIGTSASELNSFAIKLQNVVCVLTSINRRRYLQNPMITRDVLEKLSPHLISRWCDYAEEFEDYSVPEVITLSNFLMREADRALKHAYAAPSTSTSAPPRREVRPPAPPRRQENRRDVFNTHEDEQKKACLICTGSHDLPKCPKFIQMNTEARWELVKGSGYCFKCLASRHRRYQCKLKDCRIDKCGRSHHPLLHAKKEAPSEEGPTPEATVSNTSTHGDRTVLLKICPVTVSGPKGHVATYALLDEGSTITLIDQALAAEIGADGPTQPLAITTVNSSREEEQSKRVTFHVKGKGDQAFKIEARTLKNLVLHRQTIPARALAARHLGHIEASDVCYDDARPRLLLGADQWHLIASRQLKAGGKNEPVASRTSLGWVVYGTLPRIRVQEDSSVLHMSSENARTTNSAADN